jgi:hypothetical protein
MTLPARSHGSFLGDTAVMPGGKLTEGDPVAGMFLIFMTRPSVTSDIDIQALRPVAREAARMFSRSVCIGTRCDEKWTDFRKELSVLLATYGEEYGVAPIGSEGAETRGAAFDRLLDGLLLAAGRSGISFAELDLAILRGSAEVEKSLLVRPLSRVLEPADRELAQLLLESTIDQVKRRGILEGTREDLNLVHASAEIISTFDVRMYAVLKPVLKIETVRLESFLSEPSNISDPQIIRTERFNNEARCDLFALRFSFQIFIQSEVIIAQLAGNMPGMTPELLRTQLEIVRGTALMPLAAYASVPPDLSLNYYPVRKLADRLALLGETPPDPPSFSLFQAPYRALFQLHYDILLCDLITRKEWNAAQEEALNLSRPLTIVERLELKETAIKRFSQVRKHIAGVQGSPVESIMNLFKSPLNMRI